jgi:hypothetical protein
MSANIERITSIFRGVLADVPYSSAVSMYVVAGEKYPLQFGGNCLHQSKVLRERLSEAGFPNTYFLRDTLNGRHHPVLLEMDSNRYLLDPYLMANGPINLDKILQTGSKEISFDSYPIIDGEASKLILNFEDEKTFAISKTWPRITRGDHFKFNLDCLSDEGPGPEEYKSLVFAPIQDTLSIRVLDLESGPVWDIKYIVHKEGQIDEERLSIVDNRRTLIPKSKKDKFYASLDILAGYLKTDSKTLLKFMLRAAELYQKYHPENFVQSRY